MKEIAYALFTGDPLNRLLGIASFVFEFIEGESMVLLLDQNGICASSGSACSSGSLAPYHVLMAVGLPHEVAYGSLRLSLYVDNTEEDVDAILEKLPQIVSRLRDISPLWEERISAAENKRIAAENNGAKTKEARADTLLSDDGHYDVKNAPEKNGHENKLDQTEIDAARSRLERMVEIKAE